jgi:hypothetical protein
MPASIAKHCSHNKRSGGRQSRWSSLHEYICGPITLETPSSNRYFLLQVDDFSRYMWIMLLPTKDGAPMAIKNVQVAAE